MNKRRTIRDGRGWSGLLGICLMLIAGHAIAQPQPPGQTETDRALQAHQAITSAQIDVRFSQYFSYPDETEFATAEYRVLFDRANQRFRIDRPGYTLVSDGQDVLLTAEALPGRHLRMPLEGRFTYERLVEVFPDLGEPIPPAVILLMAEEPVAQLSGGQSDALTRVVPEQPAADKAVELSLPMRLGVGKMRLDAEHRRLQSMLATVDPKHLAGSGLDAVHLHYAVQWLAVNEPIDDAEFKLDVKQSHEMSTLAAFLSPNGGNAQAGPGGQGGGVPAGGSLVGMPLPEIELDQLGSDQKIKLSELDKGVVILECFASWSKTSVLDLPALSEFKAWCKEKEYDVRVYAISVGDQADHMKKWLEALGKTAKKEIDLPILMDQTTEAAMAMKLPTVPRTLIVVDGRVVDVFGGIKPTYLDDLKKSLPDWLEKVKEKKKDEEKPTEE